MAYGRERTGRDNGRITCDVLENLVVFGQRRDSGWTKEANIVSWNGGSPKLDIREWDPDHERMSKGITLYEAEAERLAKALCRRYGVGEEPRKGKRSGGYEVFSEKGEPFEDEDPAAACPGDEEDANSEMDKAAEENVLTEEAAEGGTS